MFNRSVPALCISIWRLQHDQWKLGDGNPCLKFVAHGLIEEIKLYNARETALFITAALQNSYDVHPIYHTRQTFVLERCKILWSCTQAIRTLLDPSVGDEIILIGHICCSKGKYIEITEI